MIRQGCSESHQDDDRDGDLAAHRSDLHENDVLQGRADVTSGLR
jgi:hypothetical protein